VKPTREAGAPNGILDTLKACEEAPEALETKPTENAASIVFDLAWPAVALNSLQVVNNVLDRAFLGRLSASAIAGQSASMNVTFFVFSCIMALATAPTALVSRAYGAGDHKEMKTAARKCMSMSLYLGILLGGFTALVAVPTARLLLPSTDPEAIRFMGKYLMVYAVALPAISIINNLAAALRAIGDTRSPMVLSGIQILLHMTLNVSLIFPTRDVAFLGFLHFQMPGANMGLMGAATALATSSWVSAIVYLAYSKRTPLGACWRFGVVAVSWVWRILRIAFPATVNGSIRVFSMLLFTLILKNTPEGSAAIAAMALGFAIESIMFMPSAGLSMAAAALVGQSLGMGKPERAAKLGWMAAHMAGLITLAFCIPLFLGAYGIAGVMSPGKADIIRQTALVIQSVCATEVAFAYFSVTVGAMQGAGDTVRPIWITICTLWFLRIPLGAYLSLQVMRLAFDRTMAFPFHIPPLHLAADVSVAGLGIGALGSWIAMSVSQFAQGVFGVILFQRGGWKLRRV
jgi:putative MATE family efflux protein